MNYENPGLLDRLAAEYVLGTLRGPARRRFQRVLTQSLAAQQAVWRWERDLGELAPLLASSEPRDQVWQRIAERTGMVEPRAPATERGALWRWRGWSLFSTAAALLLGLSLLLQPELTMPPSHVAQFSDDAQPLWMISANLKTGALRARAVNASAAALDRVYQLWMLPEAGTPVSLGLLPVDDRIVERELPPGLLAVLQGTTGLAISLEPAGGSPTSTPTGPVLFTAPLVSL